MFKDNSALKRHLPKNHKFECQFCTLRFVLSVDMRDHITNVHPDEAQKNPPNVFYASWYQKVGNISPKNEWWTALQKDLHSQIFFGQWFE